MNHNTLKNVIFDQHEVIRAARIVPQRHTLDPKANYVITGLRCAGKSTLLHAMARALIEAGASWEQIVYVNFEDERLAEFSSKDFNDIVLVSRKLSSKKPTYFFDEIQNVAGWEKFARRLADAGERVEVTGSNAKMLGSQIATTLGGRYLSRTISPYRFDEYLDALGQGHGSRELHTTTSISSIAGAFDRFCHEGRFPESLRYRVSREYVESVYQKELLADIATRNGIRNHKALRIMVKRVAETVDSKLSVSTLHRMFRGIGLSTGKNTIIEYMGRCQEAYLLFGVTNAVATFVEREGSPRYYLADNGLLSLFLDHDDSALLKNVVAVALHDAYGEELHYLKSPKTGIDMDFYVPDAGLAIQMTHSITERARKREVQSLAKLSRVQDDIRRLVIVTKEEQETIAVDGTSIEVIPAWRFLLQLAEPGALATDMP